MAKTTTYEMDAEDKAFEAETMQMSAEADRFLAEMKQSQKEIDRLHKENLARIERIEAAVERLLSK